MSDKHQYQAGTNFTWPTNLSWILFVFAAFVILILLPLFQKGVFMDGLLYKTVAYNYSEGSASFWNMKFTDTSMTFFCEQPPLYFFLLGMFYKLTAVHYLTDSLFTLILLTGLLFLLHRINRLIFKNQDFYLCLILFFLISIQVFCWGYVNQVIEPLVCIWVMMGCWSFIKFLKAGKNGYILLFSLALSLAFLSKGFQSCFFIGLPLFYYLFNTSKRILRLFLLAGSLLLVVLVFLLQWYKPSLAWFDCYYNARLLLTMQDVGGTTNNHADIILWYFTELTVPILSVTCLLIYLRIKKRYPFYFVFKNFISDPLAPALLLTSLLGCLPYALSFVQRAFYLIPSFLLFVLAIVFGLKRYWLYFYSSLVLLDRHRLTRTIMLVLSFGVVVMFVWGAGDYKRDENLIKDIAVIKPFLNEHEIVSIDGNLWNEFSLHSYLYMAKKVSLSVDNSARQKVLVRAGSAEEEFEGYTKVEGTKWLDLYILNPAQ